MLEPWSRPSRTLDISQSRGDKWAASPLPGFAAANTMGATGLVATHLFSATFEENITWHAHVVWLGGRVCNHDDCLVEQRYVVDLTITCCNWKGGRVSHMCALPIVPKLMPMACRHFGSSFGAEQQCTVAPSGKNPHPPCPCRQDFPTDFDRFNSY